MSKKPRRGSRQPDLIPRSKTPTIPIEPNHRLVLLTDETDWTELMARAEAIRLSKVKNAAGRPPHMRQNLGAMMLKATRDMTWREVEDQMRHYAPARYLCGLTETEWTPDFTTVHDFAVLMGEDGVKLINEYVVKWAVDEKLADPSVVVGDTTAQEAAIPYPNEIGLMAAFMTTIATAAKQGGMALKQFVKDAASDFQSVKRKVREYRLFAQHKTKAVKDRMVAAVASLVEHVNGRLGRALVAATLANSRVSKHRELAAAKLTRLHETMQKLTPQIRYWLRTGFVAAEKIISLHVPELYSIVRGKIGKKVEFGLKWGFTRLKGGFLLARMAINRRDLTDARFAVEAVKDHKALFGKAPRAYGYDRGGWSAKNVVSIKKLGVTEVGLAPQGRAKSPVSEATTRKLSKERALIEAGIGAVKSSRYNFHRPRAKSTRMMGTAGQLAVLGFNLNKLARAFAARREMKLVG
jgi:IS5 family transposase